jgi:hypothetical protein
MATSRKKFLIQLERKLEKEFLHKSYTLTEFVKECRKFLKPFGNVFKFPDGEVPQVAPDYEIQFAVWNRPTDHCPLVQVYYAKGRKRGRIHITEIGVSDV